MACALSRRDFAYRHEKCQGKRTEPVECPRLPQTRTVGNNAGDDLVTARAVRGQWPLEFYA
jgi:hypothetical protein